MLHYSSILTVSIFPRAPPFISELPAIQSTIQHDYKGPGKRGPIVADTLLPTQMFPRLPARATFVADTHFVSGTQKMFLILFRTFLCPQQHSFCVPRVSAPKKHHEQQCVRNNVSSFQGLKVTSYRISGRSVDSSVVGPGYKLQNQPCRDTTYTMRVPKQKQRKVKLDLCKLLYFEYPTV